MHANMNHVPFDVYFPLILLFYEIMYLLLGLLDSLMEEAIFHCLFQCTHIEEYTMAGDTTSY